MFIEQYKIDGHNSDLMASHKKQFDFLASSIPSVETVIEKLMTFQVAIPSWALGTGGTRFGRFSGGGEPRNLEEKIEDVGLLQTLNRSGGAIPNSDISGTGEHFEINGTVDLKRTVESSHDRSKAGQRGGQHEQQSTNYAIAN